MSEDARAKLDPLRTELGQIDREILALVAKRQAIITAVDSLTLTTAVAMLTTMPSSRVVT